MSVMSMVDNSHMRDIIYVFVSNKTIRFYLWLG